MTFCASCFQDIKYYDSICHRRTQDFGKGEGPRKCDRSTKETAFVQY